MGFLGKVAFLLPALTDVPRNPRASRPAGGRGPSAAKFFHKNTPPFINFRLRRVPRPQTAPAAAGCSGSPVPRYVTDSWCTRRVLHRGGQANPCRHRHHGSEEPRQERPRPPFSREQGENTGLGAHHRRPTTTGRPPAPAAALLPTASPSAPSNRAPSDYRPACLCLLPRYASCRWIG